MTSHIVPGKVGGAAQQVRDFGLEGVSQRRVQEVPQHQGHDADRDKIHQDQTGMQSETHKTPRIKSEYYTHTTPLAAGTVLILRSRHVSDDLMRPIRIG